MPLTQSAVAHIPRSGIRTLMELALRDPQAIHLEIGEPDAVTAPHIVEAAHAAAVSGRTGYTSSTGLPALRAAFADRVTATRGRPTGPEEIVVTTGAMHALAMAMAALLAPGDEILVPDPEFPNWRMQAVAVGAVARTYPTHAEHGFVPRAADIEAAITDRTRAILLCSPNNPTGAVYPRATIEAVYDIARRHDLWLFSDECYEAITFDVPHVSPCAMDVDGRVLTFLSLSKSYAMTGWRLGCVVIPDPKVVELMSQLAEATVACPSALSQHAGLAALTGPQDCVAEAVDSYRERRDAAVALLTARGIDCVRPDGAFYLMVDVSRVTDDSHAFALDLLAEQHVAVAPGATFGPAAASMVRVSLASERGQLIEGLSRLADHVDACAARRELLALPQA
ncbi:pyridoxal phosphate-dependent aminotransferase [Cellulomonas soli]|uniref:Aminotransferase n=1 Tax=Cellulomonas soli TaxID=931535 RepID=A0A512PA46_9CELL|nr:aminotransferase class I/II-fold pyridoxal phosphate-dependent enzyme [Cellulomonas soli]NYI60564.1 aspartate aminotransferase [Cellulomonas soli]GEP68079.1 aminotransferase [Cellulomonas soli]